MAKSIENLTLVRKLLIAHAVIMDLVSGVRETGFISEIRQMKQVDKRWKKWRSNKVKNKYSKKQLEELYNCEIFKDFGFDDSHLFWVAQGLSFTEDGDDYLFIYADGWDLDELHENIRKEIRDHCIVFDGE